MMASRHSAGLLLLGLGCRAPGLPPVPPSENPANAEAKVPAAEAPPSVSASAFADDDGAPAPDPHQHHHHKRGARAQR